MQLLEDVLLEGIVLAQTLYIAVTRFCGKFALDRCALLKLLLLLAELVPSQRIIERDGRPYQYDEGERVGQNDPEPLQQHHAGPLVRPWERMDVNRDHYADDERH